MKRRACICGAIDCNRHHGSSNWARYAAEHPDRARFYKSSGWVAARRQQLGREPSCRVCGRPAVAADHVVPRAEGGAGLDPANLESLCSEHHKAKTLAESHRGRKRAAERRRRGR